MAETRVARQSTIKIPIDYMQYIVLGRDYKVNEKIILHSPTLNEVIEFGQDKYLSFVSLITMRPYDDMVALDDAGLNYQDYTDYDIFLRNYKSITPDISSLVLNDLDLTEFVIAVNEETERPVLVNQSKGIVIDELIFSQIASFVRRINFISSKIEYDVGDEQARKYLIDKQRRAIKKRKRKKNKSENTFFLSNIISLLCCLPGCKYGYHDIVNLKISQIYDQYYRINMIDERERYLNILCTGMVKQESKDSSKLNWTRDINEE